MHETFALMQQINYSEPSLITGSLVPTHIYIINGTPLPGFRTVLSSYLLCIDPRLDRHGMMLTNVSPNQDDRFPRAIDYSFKKGSGIVPG